MPQELIFIVIGYTLIATVFLVVCSNLLRRINSSSVLVSEEEKIIAHRQYLILRVFIIFAMLLGFLIYGTFFHYIIVHFLK